MLFDTFGYWLFFAIALLLVSSLRNTPGKFVLVVMSYIFYGAWDARFVLLLGASTLANYLFGLAIGRSEGRRRKLWVTAAIAFNLGVLAFFKYFNFFIESFALLFGLDPDSLALRIILPVGVSFFTFEGIAYCVDVYRRDLKAVRDPVDFALFISFFPHLVAGPIIRPADFFPQLAARAPLTEEDTRWGLREILKGLIKKVVLADYLAPIADAYFSISAYHGSMVPAWAGVLAFSLQIYFDFSGYTDIARGCARLLGYRFPPNFERPYLSASIGEFWRRWHISLSFWLRDYLYIPLGGNRSGLARACVNMMIVMALGGLWHGASWNFVIWGIFHGSLLVIHRLWRRAIDGSSVATLADLPLLKPFWIALTFLVVTIGWVPFRAPDFASTMQTLGELAQWPDLGFALLHPALPGIAIGALLFCLADSRRRVQDQLTLRAAWPTAAAAIAMCIVALQLFAQVDTSIPFVYFQF
jgi:alginate O-acetyltransferase complex protein AlgI